MPKLSEKERDDMVDLVVKDGESVTMAARRFAVSRATVHHWVGERLKGRRNMRDKARSGRPRKLNQPAKNYLRRKADQRLSVKQMQGRVQAVRGVSVSSRTIRRTLRSGKVTRAYLAPKSEYFISNANAAKRLLFCRSFLGAAKEHLLCCDAVLLRYNSRSGKGERLFWQRLDRRQVASKVQKPSYVLVYACVGWGFKSPLFIVGTSHTRVLVPDSGDFCHVLLQIKEFISSLPKRTRPSWSLFLDNATCHRSKESVAFSNRLGIPLVFNCAQSPDLNLIENCWSLLHTNLMGMRRGTFPEFLENIQRAWAMVSDQVVGKMFAGWKGRCERVLETDGRSPVA
jgi:transposase